MPKLPISPAATSALAIEHPHILLERADNAEREGRRDEALQVYRRILSLDPAMLQAINRLGAMLGEAGDLPAAIRQFRNSLQIDPNQPDAWFNLGIAQSRQGRSQEALASFDCMIAVSPHSGAGHLQRASTLARLGRYDEAVAAFDETVRLLPDDPAAAIHRGLALQWSGKYDEALREFDRAIAIKEDFAEAWVGKAMLLLLSGDFANGFALYERRWGMALRSASQRKSETANTRPLWLGETDLAGKTILIYKEQGLGDVIQFCRYATLAANAGATVIVEVQPSLTDLMATLPGVSKVISAGDPLPDHDLRCPMMSLPLAFGTTAETIPAPVPYLRADPRLAAEWRERLAGVKGHRIGIVWGAGSRSGDSELVALEQRKSLLLQALAPLASRADCEFVSVQLGPAAIQAASPPDGMVLHDHTRHLRNFADTAALMDNLDLVISVCTSTAHLAGALGKPVWLLNRFDTDWRWFLDREDSPWYPTMRLFRQPKPGDWSSVVRSVANALADFSFA